MQGSTLTASAVRAASLALVSAAAFALALPATARAQAFGPFACTPGPEELDAAQDAHMALREGVLERRYWAMNAHREATATVRAVRRGEMSATAADYSALEAQRVATAHAVAEANQLWGEWAACRDELRRLRRYYPRAGHHARVSLGFDGAVWSLRNRDHVEGEDEFGLVVFRSPSVGLQVGWERFYTRRFGVQVNGTLAAGQGRFRACRAVWYPDCYGHPAAGGALTVAADVGVRYGVAPVVVLGLSLELRVARLPITEREQSGRRFSVSDRIIPAALFRFGPEVLLSREGRWWASPTIGYGRTLTQTGRVLIVAMRVGYVL